ncbi:MAG: hypothetical protein R3C20_03265 [Planctomycetaceae bacterium]
MQVLRLSVDVAPNARAISIPDAVFPGIISNHARSLYAPYALVGGTFHSPSREN